MDDASSTRNLVLEGESDGEVDGVIDVQIEASLAHPTTTTTTPAEEPRRRGAGGGISKATILGYSLGHFYNDLCASMWFTYLMMFMEKVLRMNSFHAGFLMLIGQVTDALSTPLVGLLSDASFVPAWMLERVGRRKSWHVLGTLCVTVSFPFIFNRCLLCAKSGSSGEWLLVLWFVPPIMLFQFGWASCQISHLALIPELTRDEHKRMEASMSMNSFRYGFTVLANLSVFGLLYWLLNGGVDKTSWLMAQLGLGGSSSEGKYSDHVGISIDPSDMGTFRTVDFMAVGTGLITSLIFWLSVHEPRHNQRSSASGNHRTTMSRSNSFSSESSVIIRMSWKNWFSHLHFYQTAVLYMFSRLYINISQVYFPFYITETQHRSKELIAILPMLAYLASLCVSLLLGLPAISARVGRKSLFLGGTICAMVNCVCLYFPLPDWRIYGTAALLGVSQATLLISSLRITANLINRNTESSAFVYGAMSFLDKFSNGATCQIVEILNPSCDPQILAPACADFYRDVMVFIPGVSALCIFATLLTIDVSKLGQRSGEPNRDGNGTPGALHDNDNEAGGWTNAAGRTPIGPYLALGDNDEGD